MMFAKLKKAREAVSNKALAVTVMAMCSVPAFAQGGDPFSTVLAEVETKVTTYAGALVGVAGISVAFMVAVKYVKKIRGAA